MVGGSQGPAPLLHVGSGSIYLVLMESRWAAYDSPLFYRLSVWTTDSSSRAVWKMVSGWVRKMVHSWEARDAKAGYKLLCSARDGEYYLKKKKRTSSRVGWSYIGGPLVAYLSSIKIQITKVTLTYLTYTKILHFNVFSQIPSWHFLLRVSDDFLASKPNQDFLFSMRKTGNFRENKPLGIMQNPVSPYGKALLSLQCNSFHVQSLYTPNKTVITRRKIHDIALHVKIFKDTSACLTDTPPKTAEAIMSDLIRYVSITPSYTPATITHTVGV